MNPETSSFVDCCSFTGITRYSGTRERSRGSNCLQNFVNGVLSCVHDAYKSKCKTSVLLYMPSMHLLCNKTKSAIAIGHLALPDAPLYTNRKSENPLNISCYKKTHQSDAYQIPIHWLHDGSLVAVAIDALELDSSPRCLPARILKLIQQIDDSYTYQH